MAKASTHVISLENVSKIFDIGNEKVYALKNVSLNVFKGEFISIEGPSGSGKSTMMNIVGCLDIPTKGKVYLDRKDISKMPESELAQIRGRKIGFVFQQFNLIHSLTALENVMLPMMFQSVPRKQREKRAAELLSRMGLESRMKHRPSELSGGQQQRVAIARALANNPEVILADEPTGNLDSKSGLNVIDFLQQLNKEGKTIIMVTHNPELSKYADRVVYLKDGSVINEKKMRHLEVKK